MYSLCAWAAVIRAPLIWYGERPLAARNWLTAAITSYPLACAWVVSAFIPSNGRTINKHKNMKSALRYSKQCDSILGCSNQHYWIAQFLNHNISTSSEWCCTPSCKASNTPALQPNEQALGCPGVYYIFWGDPSTACGRDAEMYQVHITGTVSIGINA